MTTQTFSVNEDNDLFLDREGNISISFDLEAVQQNCEHVVKTRLGEVVINTQIGIPYFETVWNGVPNLIQFQAAVRTALLQVDGVLEIVSFDTSVIDDALTYRAVISTIYGQGVISG